MTATTPLLADYDTGSFYDEMFSASGQLRPHYQRLHDYLNTLTPETLADRRRIAEAAFLNQGITFTVYGQEDGLERIFPFDVIPRIIPHAEWERLECGLAQRITALNLFLHDIYHEQHIIRNKRIPAELVFSSQHFRREMMHIDVPRDTYIHIVGSDIVRGADGEYTVLEDNLRSPSGVSYMLENRQAMKRTFADLFAGYGVLPIEHYAAGLAQHAALDRAARLFGCRPWCCSHRAFTTRPISSTPFWRGRWASRLWKAAIWWRIDNKIYTRTTRGLKLVDVIYRRIDDAFLRSAGVPPRQRAGRAPGC